MKEYKIELIRSDNTTSKVIYVNSFKKATEIAVKWSIKYPTCNVTVKEVQ